eukprot:TRINITY_DN42859_c0_g1_i1.p1 TRINITY_DN42859_c0_g1~~TRINITY_DN42859_c0_g1_i1.p1  ORF type:complete len:240 (-),score=49.29 TRINITY_DN42859_c0_g1_i1:206-925(-)
MALMLQNAFLVCFLCMFLLFPAEAGSLQKLGIQRHIRRERNMQLDTMKSNLVGVEFFVMSKCPDAQACEKTFVPVLKRLAPLVSARFTYIAKLEKGVPHCMHGSAECDGNRQRLCAAEAAGSNLTQLLDFALCQDAQQIDIPKTGTACAAAHGFKSDALASCASGERGAALLKASAERAKGQKVSVSCTLRISDKPFCVHNNGGWEACGSCGSDKAACLRKEICSLVPDSNPQKSELCA